jgi:3-hydroxybutyrate dehydrogenase
VATVDLLVDLATAEGNRAAVAGARAGLGGIDAIVPAAGFQHVAPVHRFPTDVWDRMLAVMLTSPLLLAQHAWDDLAASGDGRIVAVASVHGLRTSPGKAGYVAAKHGLVGLMRTLAVEGAERGISAVALCPGFVRTPLVEDQVQVIADARGITPRHALEDVLLERQARRTLIEVDEVASAVAFLLGPSGRAFTGAALTMDHGWTAR